MLEIFTAQYHYNGDDRLDITVKGKDPLGKVFAPSWDMVMKLKGEIITQNEYEDLYHQKMLDSYKEHKAEWEKVLDMPRVTLVCFCKSKYFCHRVLLAKYLEKLGGKYVGEKGD